MESKQDYANVAMGCGKIEAIEGCAYEQDGTALNPSLVTLFLDEQNARQYYEDVVQQQLEEAEAYNKTPLERIVFDTRVLRLHGLRIKVYAVSFAEVAWVTRRKAALGVS